MRYSRRNFIRDGSLVAGVLGAGACTLAEDAAPTASSGDLGDYRAALVGRTIDATGKASPQPSETLAPTEDNILGPFHRPAAPYRAKITPPLAPGKVLLISGRVWAHDSRQPLNGAVLDVWQANHHGRYDNDDPQQQPKKGEFLYRARLVTDENGYYEYETIHPGPYQIGRNRWRPSHIHYLVRAAGYQTLVTQMYFEGDQYNASDSFIKQSLIIDVEPVKMPHGEFGRGTFDIVLAKA